MAQTKAVVGFVSAISTCIRPAQLSHDQRDFRPGAIASVIAKNMLQADRLIDNSPSR
jgi:hypothetical protein